MAERSGSRHDGINYLNIGLMLASCAIALYVPFELFLFAYSILGPAHYLTEISWLEKRRFFTPGRYDVWLLLVVIGALALSLPWSALNFGQQQSIETSPYTFAALATALVLVLTTKTRARIILLAVVLVLAFWVTSGPAFIALAFALFVPTLIHVYLFTGFFMIYGALKERSATGYLAFAVFLLCPLVCWLLPVGALGARSSSIAAYWNNFSILNMTLLGVQSPQSPSEAKLVLQQVFRSHSGVVLMRFIAFAYTYHYLNWFSKTSIIRWHEVGKLRMFAVVGLWIFAVGLYLYDFALGFKFLFCLSLAHVYLEFPLNHVSIIGTWRELRLRAFGAPVQPALAAATAGGGTAALRSGKRKGRRGAS